MATNNAKTERQIIEGLRWAVRAVLWLGILVSVAANVLHAEVNPISQAIAAWPPVALFLTVELISRVPVHSKRLSALRIISTGAIAGIAGYVSYWHMQGVAEKYGERGVSSVLIPLTVDGLIVVASICLVEIGKRITSIDKADAEAEAARETARLAAAEDAAAKAARAALRSVQAPRQGSTVVRPSVVDLAQNAEAPAPAKVSPAEWVTAEGDEVAKHRDKRLAATLRAECLRQGRILPRDEARALLSVKTAHAGEIVKAVRASLGLASHQTTIPAEVIERESV
jgi:hypothetical protein